MPFYLRFHTGPTGCSTPRTDARRRPAPRRSNTGGVVFLIAFAAIILLIYLILRWWYVGLPILALLAIPFLRAALANRREREQQAPVIVRPPIEPPRYLVRATKAHHGPFESSGLPGPQAEALATQLRKDGWKPTVRLIKYGS
ncbi:hypothetical protein [Streptacidiphilus neutrinimicus]|uniref:hypothetical protein n=1 Tax=Streptacidiphilus neutrinimicus TaxID=105420 RepID=UPI0005AA0955|nr:hypothetical protein [Streptacidiphilus neutrinimicus]